MKVLNDINDDFNVEKVANLIMTKWGKKVVPRSVGNKKSKKY